MKKGISGLLLIAAAVVLASCGQVNDRHTSTPSPTVPAFDVNSGIPATVYYADEYQTAVDLFRSKNVYLPYTAIMPNCSFYSVIIPDIERCDYYLYEVRDRMDYEWGIQVFCDEAYREMTELYEAYRYTWPESPAIPYQKLNVNSLPAEGMLLQKSSGLYAVDIGDSKIMYGYYKDSMVTIHLKADKWYLVISGNYKDKIGNDAWLQDFLKPERVPGKLAVISEAIQAERLQAESP